jgi:hypothetical protein
MTASEKFLRFADECEVMASLARDSQSKLMWRTFAARWSAYAKSVESRFAKAHIDRMRRPHRKPARGYLSGDEPTATDTVTGSI